MTLKRLVHAAPAASNITLALENAGAKTAHMFREIKISRQPTDGRKKRWYQSDYFDLFVWYVKHEDRTAPRERREFVTMQLCYDTGGRQRALEWSKARGFLHHRVAKDSDSLSDHGAGAAELRAGGEFDSDRVLPRFMQQAPTLPPIVREFVLERLADYAKSMKDKELQRPNE